MDRLRAAFDPDGLCNPGKVLPTPRAVRRGARAHRAHPLEAAGLGERSSDGATGARDDEALRSRRGGAARRAATPSRR